MWILYVCSNEVGHAQGLERCLQLFGLTTEVHPLIIGDFWVVWRDPVTGQDTVHMSIERKKVTDFYSSIVDGRLIEQAYRATQRTTIPYIYYFLVGSTHIYRSDPKIQKAINSCQLKLSMCSRVKIVGIDDDVNVPAAFAKLINEYLVDATAASNANANPNATTLTPPTAESLRLNKDEIQRDVTADERRAMDKIPDGEYPFIDKFPGAPLVEVVQQQCKKSHIENHTDWWRQALMSLQGMSPVKADAVVHRYPTLLALFGAYEQCQSPLEQADLLSDIVVGQRTLGPAASRTIYSTVYPLHQPFDPKAKAKSKAKPTKRKSVDDTSNTNTSTSKKQPVAKRIKKIVATDTNDTASVSNSRSNSSSSNNSSSV